MLDVDRDFVAPEGHNPREVPRVRELEFGDNTIVATQEDQYGFWYLSLKKGGLPAEFRGAYTTWDAAKRDAKRYLESRNLHTMPEMRPEGPIQYKKRYREKFVGEEG